MSKLGKITLLFALLLLAISSLCKATDVGILLKDQNGTKLGYAATLVVPHRSVIVARGTATLNFFPTMTGQAGKYLTNDNNTASWGSPAGSGNMLKSDNLSGLANKTTSRANLGDGNALHVFLGDGSMGPAPGGDNQTVQAARLGGTGQDSSGWTGVPYVVGGLWGDGNDTIARRLMGLIIGTNVLAPNGSGGSLTGITPGQIGAAPTLTGHGISTVRLCPTTSNSSTAEVCNTTPTFTPVAGDSVMFQSDLANTGAFTLNVNSLGAKSVVKRGAIPLIAGDIRVAPFFVMLTYDGTNWEMEGQGGNPVVYSNVANQTVQSFINSTFDASATGNVLKQIKYLNMTHPAYCDEGNSTIDLNPLNKGRFGRCAFSASGSVSNASYYEFIVPPDLDAAIDIVLNYFKVRIGGDDHGKGQSFIFSLSNMVDGDDSDGSFGNAVTAHLSIPAGGTAANKQYTISGITLTGWKSVLTAGSKAVIKINRNGADATNDNSTLVSNSGGLMISYGSTE